MELYDDDYEQHASVEQCLLQRRNWEVDNNLNHPIINYHPMDLLTANADYYTDNNLGYSFVSGSNGFSSDFGREIGSYVDGNYYPYGGNQFQMVSEPPYDQAAPLSAPTTMADASLYSMFSAMEEEEEEDMVGNNCKTEDVVSPDRNVAGLVEDVGGQKMSGRKRVEGQPSKNLMAERRRRKRLNDRLSMLRSIVPKISKMDRTSILGDTIDYMKELLYKIQKVQEEIMESGSNQKVNMAKLLKDMKPNEMVVRNSPKFYVERRSDEDIRVEMCCSGKPSLLLSTVTTLEGLGVEIEQCVISCFNDFALQASCSQRQAISLEDIKQELFRNAGYGGKCL